MAELIKKYSKRAIFPLGEQAAFLIKAREKINISWTILAAKIGIHSRTLNGLKREEGSISMECLQNICKMADMKMPSNIEVKDPFWYSSEGGRKGWLAVVAKYGKVVGDPEYRKKKWHEWWKKTGMYRKNMVVGIEKDVSIPRLSRDLAEFTGMMLGDGGISKNQVIISTNSRDDRKYGYFVRDLMRKLFCVEPAIYYPPAALVMNIVISRIKLVEFCNKKLGLKIGHKLKQGLDIPPWIRKDSEFEKRCIRGLMDTDGCIFNEVHRIGGKLYSYKRLSLVSASPMLRQSVFDILNKFGLSPKIRGNRSVQIEDKEKIKEYFKIIGSSNPKHLKRYQN